MSGLTLPAAEIASATPEVRHWLERQLADALGLPLILDNEAILLPPDHKFPDATNGAPGRSPAMGEAPAPNQEVKMTTDNEPLVNQDIRKLIAIRAYEIWESQGCPHGRDVINWQQAEREIMECVNPDGANDTRSDGQPSSA